jgi:hypothetical protein
MRNDIHKPSKIDPEAYEFVALEHVRIETLGDCHVALANREIIRNHQDRTGGIWSHHEHGGNCMVCGAWAVYTVVFYHRESNTYVRTGNQCADKLGWGDADAFKHFQTACKSALANKAGKAKAQAVLEEEGLGELWPIFLREDDLDHEDRVIANAAWTICDIISKLVQYGNISDKALEYLKGLKKRIDTWPAVRAEREAEKALADPVPAGRVVVTGEVLKVDWKDYGDFERHVFTVKDDRGFVVWGTVPRAIDNVERGDRVTFTASLEPSDTDTKFGFFKRPTKPEIHSEKSELAFALKRFM